MTGPLLFTIGHSNRSIEEFIELLRENSVGRVVDVRKLAGSAKYPQFNSDQLRASLEASGIGYSRAEALAGRRPVSKTVPFAVNAWWQNRSFHNYADYALSEDFTDAIATVLETTAARSALMCAEAVWWRCHRRVIADHLLARHAEVMHILGKGQTTPATMSGGAVVTARGVEYPLPD